MRLLDREILRCEGKIPQFAPSAQLRGKLLYNVSLRAIESSECFGDSEGARLGNEFFSDFRRVQKPHAHAAAPSKTPRPRCRAVPQGGSLLDFWNSASSAALSLASSSAWPLPRPLSAS